MRQKLFLPFLSLFSNEAGLQCASLSVSVHVGVRNVCGCSSLVRHTASVLAALKLAGVWCLHVREALIVSLDPVPLARDKVDQPVLLLVLRGSSSGRPLPCEGVCDLASRALCPQPPYTAAYNVICKCGLPGGLWLIG